MCRISGPINITPVPEASKLFDVPVDARTPEIKIFWKSNHLDLN
ncbi:Uncharacterised protein [Chlamydia trachomatis]|nr:Uncharacterised protein [Chlamydia trachomatis]